MDLRIDPGNKPAGGALQARWSPRATHRIPTGPRYRAASPGASIERLDLEPLERTASETPWPPFEPLRDHG